MTNSPITMPRQPSSAIDHSVNPSLASDSFMSIELASLAQPITPRVDQSQPSEMSHASNRLLGFKRLQEGVGQDSRNLALNDSPKNYFNGLSRALSLKPILTCRMGMTLGSPFAGLSALFGVPRTSLLCLTQTCKIQLWIQMYKLCKLSLICFFSILIKVVAAEKL